VLLASCAIKRNATMKDTAALAPGDGVMVANISVWSAGNVPYPALSIQFDKRHGLSSPTSIRLPDRSNLIVLELPAGEYTWTSLELGMVSAGTMSYRMPFIIEPGKINYVGDLLLALYSIRGPGTSASYRFLIADQSKYRMPKVAAYYPQLVHAYPTVIHLTQDLRPTKKMRE
jgi:hypothetical protein